MDRKVLVGDLVGGMVRHEQGEWNGSTDRVADPAGRVLALLSEISAAAHGIEGAVDAYADLPDPTTLELGAIYIVREDTGAPNGNGLYRVEGDPKTWVYLDGLNLQVAGEVPYSDASDNGSGASAWNGTAPANVAEAIDRLASCLAKHLGSGAP